MESTKPGFHDRYHANPGRTDAGYRMRRDDEARREASRQRSARKPPTQHLHVVNRTPVDNPTRQHKEHQWAGATFAVVDDNQYPTMEEIDEMRRFEPRRISQHATVEEAEEHERHAPRGRNERFVPCQNPPMDERYRSAYNTLNGSSSSSRSTRTSSRRPSPEKASPGRDPWNGDAGLARPGTRKAPAHIQTAHAAYVPSGRPPSMPDYNEITAVQYPNRSKRRSPPGF
ncbi:hypothetical protein ACLMJK_005801 [Lecanora helva]